MTVLDIREEGEGGGGSGGWRFSWTNETLPLQYCPREEVNYLLICSWTSSGSAGWGLSGSVFLSLFSTSPSWLQSPILHYVVEAKLFLWFLKLSLRLATVLALFTALGIMFQLSITRLEKKFLLISNLAAFCLRLSGQSALPPSAASWKHVLWSTLSI